MPVQRPDLQIEELYNNNRDRADLGLLAGSIAGVGTLGALLKQWGLSEAMHLDKLRKSGIEINKRMHPVAMLGGGALLGYLGKLAKDKYDEYKARNRYY